MSALLKKKTILGLVLVVGAAWLWADFNGQRVDAPKAGVALVAEMVALKPLVSEAILRNGIPEAVVWQAAAPTAGMQVRVTKAGVIEGVYQGVAVRLVPRLEKNSNSIIWTCEGSPSDQVPRACTQ